MAAYAALVSVMNTLANIQNHPRLSSSLDENQIQSLREKLDFLLDFVESYSSHGDGGISKEAAEDLEGHIASAARVAEDAIESHAADLIHAGFPGESSISLLDLQKIIEGMDSVKQKVMKVKAERVLKGQQLKYSKPAASSRLHTAAKTTSMVGFDRYLDQLLDGLTGPQSDWQIIPIVGMGGIGKTTLARHVYGNLLVVQHFYVRAWVTVSQQYDVREILLEIFSCIRESIGEEETEDRLGERLYKFLSGRRYLIILDDMWSIEAWSKIQFFFPRNDNRSRIIVTTRQSDLANHFGSLGLALDFLDGDEGWNLFREKAFAREGCCPPELEEIAKRIVKKCKGLPLSIVLIEGLLGKSSRAQEHWENVEKDLSSIVNSAEDNECMNILSLSYNYLPARLKPCFLYLGIFPEDRETRVSRIVKLWVAEGFLKARKEQSLEEVAEGYIKDLVDRNLVLVRKLGSNGKFKTCIIHDLVRDLCVKVAEKEKFFRVMRVLDTPRDRDRDRERRIGIHGSAKREQYYNWVFHTLKSASFARSIISESWHQLWSKSRLLRVLCNAYADSDAIFRRVNLRFLLFCPISQYDRIHTYKLPSSISLLWNLQTLEIAGEMVKVFAPPEIWGMPQLRHLKFVWICLPDPPPSDERDGIALQNLQTLGRVLNFRWSEEACKKMSNIKKLRIDYADFSGEGGTNLSDYCLYTMLAA